MISKHHRQHLRSPVLCTLFALAITSGSHFPIDANQLSIVPFGQITGDRNG
jgi:hypothetical protein